jgi:hypothetical protein
VKAFIFSHILYTGNQGFNRNQEYCFKLGEIATPFALPHGLSTAARLSVDGHLFGFPLIVGS